MPAPSRDEIRAKLRADLRTGKIDASPGARFRRSSLGQRLASRGKVERTEVVEVTKDPWEFARFLRTRAFVDDGLLTSFPDAERQIQIRPTPTSFLQLVTPVPTTSPEIPTVVESLQIEDAAATPDFTNLPGTPGVAGTGPNIVEWSVENLSAERVGRAVQLPMTVLQDAGQAEAMIDRLITQNFRRAVENYIVAGTTAPFVGITQTTGVVTVDGTGLALPDALAEGVAAVQNEGFWGALAVVASPNTLKAVFTAKDLQDNYLRVHSALPAVESWVPTMGLPDGTAIVCDPAEVLLYLMGSFTIEISTGILDYLVRNLALVKGAQRCAIWVRNPGAFCVVDNL